MYEEKYIHSLKKSETNQKKMFILGKKINKKQTRKMTHWHRLALKHILGSCLYDDGDD